MADLQALQDFAEAHGFGLTHPLRHNQVVRLAENWLPQIFFYETESFHPISLDEVISMVEDRFEQLPDNAQDEWRVSKTVRIGTTNTGEVRAFAPPVVHVPDGAVVTEGQLQAAVRVLNDGSSTRAALEHSDVDDDAVISHGASFRTSNQFFGATETVFNGAVPTAGDPFVPRATRNDGRPRITILAAYLNLLEALKYELTVEDAAGYPPDGLRGGFDIAGTLLDPSSPALLPERRQVLLDLIAAHEANEDAIPPPGWKLDGKAWDAVTRYAFLEYSFFYAYNDFDRVQTTLFENEHEGDDEGCCLVFDRNVINVAAAGNDPDLLLHAVPHSIITSVHEEFQDADDFKFIPTPIPPADDPDRPPRQDLDLSVYVAWGSHATYLTKGDHELVDWGDVAGFLEENPALLLAIAAAPNIALALAIIAVISEHFNDTHDVTSEDGIRTGPEEVVGDDPLGVLKRLIVMPMSARNHIYQPQHVELLRLRAFPGKWGGHDGFIDKSTPFKAKTGRYLRKLMKKL
jgi:hypothetical protein